MWSELLDAGNVSSLSMGLVIGYVIGRMKTRTEHAEATAHAAYVLAEELKKKLLEEENDAQLD